MTDYLWLRDTVTGKVERYPARFQHRPGLEVDDGGGICTSCAFVPEQSDPAPTKNEDEDNDAPDYYYFDGGAE